MSSSFSSSRGACWNMLTAGCFVLALISSSVNATSMPGTKQSKNGAVTFKLIPHKIQQERRRLEEGSSTTHEDAALYQGYGTHYVDLWVGTPPQRQTVIVDTGSSITAFPCLECSNCGEGYHIDEYFAQDLSPTFEVVDCDSCTMGNGCGFSSSQCEMSVSYQEGSSWRAYEVSDVAYTGGAHYEAVQDCADEGCFRFHFGCQTHLTGLFKTQLADGIMGMEMSETSYWMQAYQQQIMSQQMFSLCFSRQDIASRKGTPAGVMALGGVSGTVQSTPMVYAEQLSTSGWFSIRLKGVYLRLNGGESVLAVPDTEDAKIQHVPVAIAEKELNDGNVIIDSGTTDTYLTRHLSTPFQEAFKQLTGGGDWSHFQEVSLTEEALLAMPTILFHIEGATRGDLNDAQSPGMALTIDPDADSNDILVAMPPSHYMEYSVKTRKYTSRIYFTESHGGVLGANFMMGHEILFDRENQRVGFSESDCNYDDVEFSDQAAEEDEEGSG